VCCSAGLPLGAADRGHADPHRLACRLRDHTSGTFGMRGPNLSPAGVRTAPQPQAAARAAGAAAVGIRPTPRRASIRQALWKAPASWEFGAFPQWRHFAGQFG
jgi:hypothetical protein